MPTNHMHPELKDKWNEIAEAIHAAMRETPVSSADGGVDSPELRKRIEQLCVGQEYTPALLGLAFGEVMGLQRGISRQLAVASALVGRGRFLVANNEENDMDLLAGDAILTRGLSLPAEWEQVPEPVRLKVAGRFSEQGQAHRAVAESLIDLARGTSSEGANEAAERLGPVLIDLAESMDKVAESAFEGVMQGIGDEDRTTVTQRLFSKWRHEKKGE